MVYSRRSVTKRYRPGIGVDYRFAASFARRPGQYTLAVLGKSSRIETKQARRTATFENATAVKS